VTDDWPREQRVAGRSHPFVEGFALTSRPALSVRAEQQTSAGQAHWAQGPGSAPDSPTARLDAEHRAWIVAQLVERLGRERAERDLPLGGVVGGVVGGASDAGGQGVGLFTPTATVVQVTVASAALADVLQRRYGPLLDELASACGRAVQWSVATAAPAAAESESKAGAKSGTEAGPRRLGRATPLSTLADPPEPTLASTVVGGPNRLAVDGLRRVLAGQLPPGVPVFLHGACGVGKTHLLRALAHDWTAQRLGSSARCMTAEQFANEFGGAVRSQRVDGFRKRVRGVDLLCIDDLQSLAGKEGMQAELVHTLDALMQRRACVVVAGAQTPRRLSGLSDALISRLAGGLVAEVHGPDVTMATHLVMAFAARRGLLIDEPVARAIATGVGVGSGFVGGGEVSVRDLEGAVTKVEAVHRLLGASISAGRVSGSVRTEPGHGPGAGEGGPAANATAGVAGAVAGAGGVGAGGAGARVGLIAVRRALGHDQRGPGSYPGPGAESGQGLGAGSSAGLVAGHGSGVGAGFGRGAAGLRRPLTPAQVVACVCERLGVTPAELAGRGRHRRVVLARAMATAVSRRLTSGSYPEIARAIGRPNHSTVITAHQRLSELIAANGTTEEAGGQVALSALLEELCQLVQARG
jgi:chromosomal replication initiator protein